MRIRIAIHDIFVEMVNQLSNEFNDTMTIIKICAKTLEKIMQILDLYEYKTNIALIKKKKKGKK